jgi:type IV secretory pathway TrbL component
MRQGSKVAAWDAWTGGVATEYSDVASGGQRHGRRGMATARATCGVRRRVVDGSAAQGAGSTVRMD